MFIHQTLQFLLNPKSKGKHMKYPGISLSRGKWRKTATQRHWISPGGESHPEPTNHLYLEKKCLVYVLKIRDIIPIPGLPDFLVIPPVGVQNRESLLLPSLYNKLAWQRSFKPTKSFSNRHTCNLCWMYEYDERGARRRCLTLERNELFMETGFNVHLILQIHNMGIQRIKRKI